jgi:CRP/FNR family cyclic AMP-dependent transcriptional regulator
MDHDNMDYGGTPDLSNYDTEEALSPVNLTHQDKLRLVRSIALLKNMPDRTNQKLAELLKVRKVADGETIFEEGSRGMSMYFVASGRVRIYKQTAGGFLWEIAIVAAGDFFGDMSLIDEVPRSASAVACGTCMLFELYSGDLNRWVQSSAPQALQFFSELSHVLSRRLRKTSRQLTLHFDLATLLGDHRKGAPEFIRQALERVLLHLGGPWASAAFLNADRSTTIVCAESSKENQFENASVVLDKAANSTGSWIDDETFGVALNRHSVTLGTVVFRCMMPLQPAEQDDHALTLTSACSLITTGLEIIALRS